MINSAETGGAQTLLEAMALNRKSGSELRLLVLQRPDTMSERLEHAFDSVSYAGMHGDDRNPLPAIRSLGRTARSFRPDVVHSHLFLADFISLTTPLGNAARVTTVHQSGLAPSDPKSSVVVVRLVALMSRRLDAAVATSNAAAGYMRTVGYRETPVLIHNGVPIPSEPEPYESGSVKVVSLARWHPMKAHDVLFSAFRLVKDHIPGARLVCAGGGMTTDNSALVALLGRAGLSLEDDVDLLGPVARVGNVLNGAACLVLSSSSTESWPMVGGEATAHGIPVITTNVGDAATFAVAPEHVVPPRSPALLADAISTFLSLDHERRLQFSVNARAKAVSEFSVTRTVDSYDDVYRSCAASKATPV